MVMQIKLIVVVVVVVSSRNAPPHDTKRLRGVENVLFGGSSNRVTNVRRWFHSSLI